MFMEQYLKGNNMTQIKNNNVIKYIRTRKLLIIVTSVWVKIQLNLWERSWDSI